MKIANRIIISFFLFLLCSPLFAQATVKPKYIFYLIGDGMGIAQVYSADKYLRSVSGDSLTMLTLPVCGLSTTSAANQFITCSAAAGTALATGNKAHVNTIGISPDGNTKYNSVAYDAQQHGYKVGIVSSVPVNHATPAAFYAHQPSRNMYSPIAYEMAQSNFDFFAAGAFSVSTGSLSELNAAAVAAGYKLDSTKAVLSNTTQCKRFVYPTSTNGGENLPFVLDRTTDNFSLVDFANYGIQQLYNPKGFFLMIEGGKIDWACHSNDAAASIHEVIEFDLVVKQALQFYNEHPTETLIVITADHETGGMSLGNNTLAYDSKIKLLQYQTVSKEVFSEIVEKQGTLTFDAACELAKKYYGLGDVQKGLELSADDIVYLKQGYDSQFGEKSNKQNGALYSSAKSFAEAVTSLLVAKSGLTFSTKAHTACPVPVFSIGVGSAAFDGFIDNTDIAKRLKGMVNSD